MKILVVSQHFSPENFRINEVVASLVRAGCNVTVLTGQPNYPGGKVFPGYSAASIRTEFEDNVLIYRVPEFPRGAGTALRLILNYVSFVLSFIVLGPYVLRSHSFDAVLVYASSPILVSIPGIVIGAIKRAVVITWVQDLWPESLTATNFVRNRHLLKAVAALVRWIYRHNDLLLVQSQTFIEPVRAMALGTPVVYHPNPGEVALTRMPAEGETKLRLNPGFNVIFAGNFGTVQALETILDAADKTRKHVDLWWVLVGSGRRTDWLIKEVQRRELTQVLLPGRFPPQAMPQIFHQASALLVTLVRNPIMSKTIPSKVQAYLAAGRPIIAALDGEGARVVTEAKAGVVCPAEDASALADAVLTLKDLPIDDLQRFGAAGRIYYETHFDPDVLAERLTALVQDTIAKSSASRKSSRGEGERPMRP